MIKIYLGGPMFDLPNVRYNLYLAGELRALGFEVYCPNENKDINDKSRGDLTSERIYEADVEQLLSSNIFLCQVSEDSGTMWEAGFMDCLSKHVDPKRYLGVIGLATDIRLATRPNPERSGIDNLAFAINGLITGGLKRSLGCYTTEETLFARLKELKETTV